MSTLLLDALQCKNKSRPPIWLMRQAGRYLPEYQAMRKKHSLMKMFHEPELAAEVTHLPFREFELDAAIIFSDILMIPEVLGVGLNFKDGVGPIIERPLNNSSDLDKLQVEDIAEKLRFVTKAIELAKPGLKVPLFGFSGAPFTVASYMIEGGSSKDLRKTKQWMMQDPESFHRLLSIISKATIEYLNMQIDAGVEAIQIFDSWASVLGHRQFMEFSLKYMKEIIDGLKDPNIPVVLFCRASSVFAKELASINPSGISIDWNSDITQMRPMISEKVALQGNLDPDLLFAPRKVVEQEARRIIDGMRGDEGFIFNLGHGIKPGTPLDSVKALVDVIQSY